MILTGAKIIESVYNGDIFIDPFLLDQVNPNSYNYRLGKTLIETGVDGNVHSTRSVEITSDGLTLHPRRLYLGHTYEIVGSRVYAMSLIGRSSIGRLGMFLQISANLGHTRSCHSWTLEIYALRPITVYPAMEIGQISFWRTSGALVDSVSEYVRVNIPHRGRFWEEGGDDPHR